MRFLKENWKLECILFCVHEICTGKYVIRNCFPLSFNKETSSTKFILMIKRRLCIFYQKFLLSNVSIFFVFLFFLLSFSSFFHLLPFSFSLFLCLCVTLSKSVFQSFLSFNETLCSSLLVFGSCCLSGLLSYAVSWLSSAFTAL